MERHLRLRSLRFRTTARAKGRIGELTVEDADGRSRVFTTKYSFSNNHIEPDAVGVTRVGGHGAVMAPPPGAVAAAAPPVAASGEPEPDFASFDVE